MPALIWSTAMTANQLGLNPLAGWQYEYAPYASAVTLLQRATTAGVRETVYSGSETIKERSPVQGGGTIGVTPSALNTTPTNWICSGGDRLKLLDDEVLGGTPTVDGVIVLDPI
jgi:hypothetical protein